MRETVAHPQNTHKLLKFLSLAKISIGNRLICVPARELQMRKRDYFKTNHLCPLPHICSNWVAASKKPDANTDSLLLLSMSVCKPVVFANNLAGSDSNSALSVSTKLCSEV